MVVCGVCGTESPAGAKFCHECAAPLTPAAPPPAEVRKTVTLLFCDVTGSTALGEQLDPEAMRTVMTRYFSAMSRVIEAHGGLVEKFAGDAVMAMFGIPAVHEDDALRALRAAVGMAETLDALNADLQTRHGVRLGARIGVNTGEVVVGGGDPAKGTVATGDAVNVAARLEQAAAPGEILFGPRTHALVRDLVDAEPVEPLTLKGKAEPVPAWRLHKVSSTETAARSVLLASPLVGRDDELQLLRQALARSTAARRPQLVTLLGAAGVGKTRLVTDLVGGLDPGTTVLTGRCLSYGEDIVFWPLLDVLRQATGIAAGDSEDVGTARLRDLFRGDPEAGRLVERLAPLAGLPGTPADADEIQWAVRRLVETLGRRGRVVLVLDDLHWAEPAMLDVVEHLAAWTRDTPLLLVCIGRPELLDDRPQWAGGTVNALTVLLEPLDGDAAETMLANLLRGSELDRATRARILAAAGGMPLYVEQMIAMLADEGVLSGDADATRPLEVPPTIAALLAARLDRLSADERAVLEAAAVIGTTVYVDAVAQLVGAPAEDARRSLMALARKELVRPDPADLPGEEGFRFLHVMVRDSAYAGISKSRRSDLHETFARWLDDRGDTHAVDVDEFVGHHLEQAVLLRRELGPSDPATRELAAAAVARLMAHAHRLAAADPLSAASLYDRAAHLAETGTAARLDSLRRAGSALEYAGEWTGAAQRCASAVEEAVAAGDERRALMADLSLITVEGHIRPGWDGEAALPRIDAAVRRFRDAGDDEGLLVAASTAIGVLNELCTWAPIVALADEMLPVAERLGDHMQRENLRQYQGMARHYGPTPLDEVLAFSLALPTFDSRLSEMGHLCGLAAVLAASDRPEEAREALARAEELLADLTNPVARAMAGFGAGDALLHLGDPDAAEAVLRRGIAAMDTTGERAFQSSLAIMLGSLRLDQGDPADARRWAELGRDLSSAADRLSQAQWRALLARLEAAEGRHADAVALADEAVRLIELTDDLAARGKVLEDRATVWALAGGQAESLRDLYLALERYDVKRDLVCSRRVRARLDQLAPPGS